MTTRQGRVRTLALALALVAACTPAPAEEAEPVDQGGPDLGAPSRAVVDRAAWIASVQRGADAQYAWRAEESGWAAQTPAASFAFGGEALTLTAAGAPWRLRLRTEAVGRGARRRELDRAAYARRPRTNELAMTRGPVVERWVHGPLGVEHILVVHERPAGAGRLSAEVRVDGLTALADGAAVVLTTGRVVRARYSDLYVHDAAGRSLPARFVAGGDRIDIEVDDRGAAYPVTIDPLVWRAEQTIEHDNGAIGDRFGIAVALSEDGTRSVIGAQLDDTAAGMDRGTGRAFLRSAGVWAEEETLEPAGVGVEDAGVFMALDDSGTRALVAVPFDDSAVGVDAGTVRVFLRTGTTWTEEATLAAVGLEAGDAFGLGVALSGDGTRAVVGAPNHDTAAGARAGAAWVFRRTGTSWAEEQMLEAAGAAAGDGFGSAVGLAADGTRVVIGAPFETTTETAAGTARVFARTGTTWVEEATLELADPVARDTFGLAVAMDGDGTRAVVGGPGLAGARGGTARVFGRDGTDWTEEDELVPAGAPLTTDLGLSVDIDDAGALVVAGQPNEGSARLWSRAGAAWAEEAVLVTLGIGPMSGYGGSVGISGDGSAILVGAPDRSPGGATGVGAAVSFALLDTLVDGEPCPLDAVCDSGFCVDGVCCDSACGGGEPGDCEACVEAETGVADGSCQPLSAARAAMIVCRESAGACDPEETCSPTETGCPADALAPDTTECRASTGGCDPAERCDGVGVDCPDDALAEVGAVCRDAAGVCDGPELCDGESAECPADVLLPADTECRAATCADGTEVAPASCDGASAECPAPVTADCAPFVCDVAACRTDCMSDDDCQAGFACEAPTCVMLIPDAGPPDAGPPDQGPPPMPDLGVDLGAAAPDAGPEASGGGCSCRVGAASATGPSWMAALLLLVLGVRRRR